MTKVVFAAGVAVFVLTGTGLVTVPAWGLALACGGMGAALFQRRSNTNDGEVSC